MPYGRHSGSARAPKGVNEDNLMKRLFTDKLARSREARMLKHPAEGRHHLQAERGRGGAVMDQKRQGSMERSS